MKKFNDFSEILERDRETLSIEGYEYVVKSEEEIRISQLDENALAMMCVDYKISLEELYRIINSVTDSGILLNEEALEIIEDACAFLATEKERTSKYGSYSEISIEKIVSIVLSKRNKTHKCKTPRSLDDESLSDLRGIYLNLADDSYYDQDEEYDDSDKYSHGF